MAQGSGSSYAVVDAGVKAGRTYTYWLVETDTAGASRSVALTTLSMGGCALDAAAQP